MTTSASRHNEKYHALRNNNNFRNEGILESWATASNVVLGHGRPWLDQQIPIFLVVDILFVGGDGWCWWLKIDTVKSNKRCTLWYFQPINNHDSVYLFVDGFASEILGDLWEIFRNKGFVLTATGWMSGCLDRSKGFMRGQGKRKMDDGLV